MQCELRLGGGCNGMEYSHIFLVNHHIYHNINLNSFITTCTCRSGFKFSDK
jgi:hypothetical protein